MRSMKRIGLLALLVVAQACVDRDPFDPTQSADTSLTPQASVAGGEWAVGPFTAYAQSWVYTLRPAATHVCVLTNVQGKFAGGGEYVRVQISGSNWVMRGGSKQSGVGGEAHCFAKSAFLANGTARWISPEFIAVDSKSSCAGNSVHAWWGDAATMLSGTSGEYEGGGERSKVVQSPGAFTPSAVAAESCQGWHETRAYSFFAGQPHVGQLARFYGGEYSATLVASDVNTSLREVRMAPVGEAMCYLTYVGGDFGGGAERVRIYQKTSNGIPYWYLQVTAGKLSGGDRRYMRGMSRCYKRDQR